MSPLDQLKARMAEVSDLKAAAALLSWDQQTYMPSGGAAARAEQIATLEGLAHARFVSEEVGAWLEGAAAGTRALSYESDDASLVRLTRGITARLAEFRRHWWRSWPDRPPWEWRPG